MGVPFGGLSTRVIQDPGLRFPFVPRVIALALIRPSSILNLLLHGKFTIRLRRLLSAYLLTDPSMGRILTLAKIPVIDPVGGGCFRLISVWDSALGGFVLSFLVRYLFGLLFSRRSRLFFVVVPTWPSSL